MELEGIIRSVARRLPLPPIVGTFEASKVCNLRCSYCRRWQTSSPSHLNNEKKFFLLREMEEVISNIPSLREIGWMEDGEPLLNPEFNDIISYLSSKGRVSTFTTNGTLVTKELVAFWKTHKVKKIVVSLDHPNPDKYEAMRLGASFSKTLEACNLISKAGILLQLNIVMFQETVKDIPDFIELAGRVGARRVYLIRPHFINSIGGPEQTFPIQNAENVRILSTSMEQAKKYKITWNLPWFLGPYFRRCMSPFLSFYMEIGGNVQACCYSQGSDRQETYKGVTIPFYTSAYTMGNALNGNFTSIWKGNGYKGLRKELINSEEKMGYKGSDEDLVSLRSIDLRGIAQCRTCLWRWGLAC